MKRSRFSAAWLPSNIGISISMRSGRGLGRGALDAVSFTLIFILLNFSRNDDFFKSWCSRGFSGAYSSSSPIIRFIHFGMGCSVGFLLRSLRRFFELRAVVSTLDSAAIASSSMSSYLCRMAISCSGLFGSFLAMVPIWPALSRAFRYLSACSPSRRSFLFLISVFIIRTLVSSLYFLSR